MANHMSRRFSTLEFSTPTYQKDMTNDVRLKLAKVRARSRSFCAPSFPTSTELKTTKKSSQLPRSTVTALTTSAKAKLKSPHTSNRPNMTIATITPPEVNKRHSRTNKPLAYSSTRTNHQRSKSTKSTVASTTKNGHTDFTRPEEQEESMIKFFESDSDEDELFLRHVVVKPTKNSSNQQTTRRQRRVTMPPRLPSPKLSETSLELELDQQRKGEEQKVEKLSSLPAKPDNKQSDTTTVWTELADIKSRLEKLESQQTRKIIDTNQLEQQQQQQPFSTTTPNSSSHASPLLSPRSSLVDSACSLSNEMPTQSQKLLRDTVLNLEYHVKQDFHSGNNTAFMNTLIALVTETINMNQTLSSYGAYQQQRRQPEREQEEYIVEKITCQQLESLQKSSERQVHLLADTLQSLAQQQLCQHQHQHQQGKQQYAQDHLVSPPLSHSALNINSENVSPRPTKPNRPSSIQSFGYQQQQKESLRPRSYNTYHYDETGQNYTEESSSQHSNIPTANIGISKQHRRSIVSTSSVSSSHLPHYTKYLGHEVTAARQQPSLAAKPVSGILHHHHYASYQQQEPQGYQPSQTYQDSNEQQQSPHIAFHPMSSTRVNRLLSMYEKSLKPSVTTVNIAASTHNMSPPLPYSQHRQEQEHLDRSSSYIDLIG